MPASIIRADASPGAVDLDWAWPRFPVRAQAGKRKHGTPRDRNSHLKPVLIEA